MDTLLPPQRLAKGYSEERTPKSFSTTLRIPVTPNSQMKSAGTPKDQLMDTMTPLHGYNTFTTQDIGGNNLFLDDNYHGSPSQMYFDKHPTQSFYSMHSMLHMRRISDYTQSRFNIRIYSWCGEVYRKCCFTSIGMKLILSTNVVLVLLNLYLVIYEGILLSQSNLNTPLPITFFVCDIFITGVLLIEVILHWIVGYMGSCYHYLCNSTLDNKMDVIVMGLSVLCCILYVTAFEEDMDNLFFLLIRITRDLVRIIRCYFFFRLLHQNLALDLDLLDHATFHVQHKGGGTKSMQSNRWWDKYEQHRRKGSPVTVCKLNSRTATGLTLRIPEDKEYKDEKGEDVLSVLEDIKSANIYKEDHSIEKTFAVTPVPPLTDSTQKNDCVDVQIFLK